MQYIDYQGLAILVSAIGTFITVIAGTAMSFMNFLASKKRDEHLAEIKTLVNGQSHALNDAVRQGAFAAGQRAGRLESHAQPVKTEQDGTS